MLHMDSCSGAMSVDQDVQYLLATVVLSPHIDDAAFSVGSMILEQRFLSVTVINVFTVSRCTVDDWEMDAENVSSLRKAEDDRFFQPLCLGASRRYLGRLDAPLRLKIPDTQVCRMPAPAWGDIEVEQVRCSAMNLVTPDALLVAPLGLGGHIDHMVVRMAAGKMLC